MRYGKVAAILAGAGVILCAAAASGAWFMPLPQFQADPGQPGDAFAVSADGSTVVGTSDAGAPLAVRWVLLDGPEGVNANGYSYARGVSADGKTVAGYVLGVGNMRAFRWRAGIGVDSLGDLSGGEMWSRANDVSFDGSVIVGASSSSRGGEAFRWTEGTGLVALGDLPGRSFAAEAQGVSADGSVIVGLSESANGVEAFRWTAETGMVGLGDVAGGGFFSDAYDVSGDGSVVVGRSAGSVPFYYNAFRWTAETGMVALPSSADGSLPDIAQAVSGDGNVIVGALHTGDRAFAWDSFHETRDIAELLASQGVDIAGWELGIARGVSYDGLTIAGYGLPPNTRTRQPWVVRLDPGTFVPEPGAIVMAVVGLVGVGAVWARRGWRKRRMRMSAR